MSPDVLPAVALDPSVQVLVVERDALLAGMLCMVLQQAGYRVETCPFGALARARLQWTRHPVVVVLTHGSRDQDGEHVLAAITTLPPHRYLLLVDEQPEHAPRYWNPHTHAPVPVLHLPFDINKFVDQIGAAISQLDALSTGPATPTDPQDPPPDNA